MKAAARRTSPTRSIERRVRAQGASGVPVTQRASVPDKVAALKRLLRDATTAELIQVGDAVTKILFDRIGDDTTAALRGMARA